MDETDFCLLMAAIYFAPHTNSTFAVWVAFAWLVAAVLVWRKR